MKKLILGLLLSLILSVPTVKSQTVNATTANAASVTAGISGADDFDNLSAGITLGLNVPIKRFEFNLADTYSPYETHIGLGSGYANIATFTSTVWATNRFGITGKIEDSGYSVTDVSKTAFYVLGGASIKVNWLSVPTRFGFGYAGQFNNGIVNGIETSHLHGAYFSVEGHPYCAKSWCIKIQEMFTMGQVLTQGNPVCDGTLGNGSQAGISPCPRGKATGGGVEMNLLFERYLHKHDADTDTIY